jgi:tight adherence protein B
MFDFDPIYVIWLFVAAAAVLAVEAVCLTSFSAATYRRQINRRLMLESRGSDRESVLIAWRRERGLTDSGDYRIKLTGLNRLVLQSGITIGLVRLLAVLAAIGLTVFCLTLYFAGLAEAAVIALLSTTLLPYLSLRYLRARRQKKFSAQLPDALDTVVRSLRAGHPVPTALSMVGREMADPIGSEFAVVTDEISYGVDIETAMRSLDKRIGADDLPLFITAVGIQSSIGGNLGEILENLSTVIRDRFKMRRKVRALAAEGRASALILSALPVGLFVVIQMTSPEFYAAVWHENLTKLLLVGSALWMLVGNLVMFKMVNFKI